MNWVFELSTVELMICVFQVPSVMSSQMDIVTNESTAASETVPAEKEGDMDFYPDKKSAEPSVHNR